MEALARLNENDLQAALAEAKQWVKKDPANGDARGLLAQLFCFSGEWDRADKQFEILSQQNTEMKVGVSLVRQLIRAEIARNQFYDEGRMPEVIGEPDENLKLLLRAIVELREGNVAEAAAAVQSVREHALTISGKVNGKEFHGGSDLDDLVCCFFEVITTNGKFYLVPMDKVISIEFRPYERLQDRIWRSATIQVEGFSEQGEVYFPVNYAADSIVLKTAADEIKLGNKTDWYAAHADAPVRGMGQKLFVFGDEQYALMELNSFESAAEA